MNPTLVLSTNSKSDGQAPKVEILVKENWNPQGHYTRKNESFLDPKIQLLCS